MEWRGGNIYIPLTARLMASKMFPSQAGDTTASVWGKSHSSIPSQLTPIDFPPSCHLPQSPLPLVWARRSLRWRKCVLMSTSRDDQSTIISSCAITLCREKKMGMSPRLHPSANSAILQLPLMKCIIHPPRAPN